MVQPLPRSLPDQSIDGPVNAEIRKCPRSKPIVTHVDKLKPCATQHEPSSLFSPSPPKQPDGSDSESDPADQLQRPRRTIRSLIVAAHQVTKSRF